MNNDSKQLAKIIYEAISDKKAEDITIIDISEVSVIADYFIICSANNRSQMDAITDSVGEVMFKSGFDIKRVEGGRMSGWILMDYNDIIVHVFSKEERAFYDLERIWRDGKKVDPKDL